MRYSFHYERQPSPGTPRDKIVGALTGAGIPALPGYSSAPADPRLQKAFADQGDLFPNSQVAQEQIIGIHHMFLLRESRDLLGLVEVLRESLASG